MRCALFVSLLWIFISLPLYSNEPAFTDTVKLAEVNAYALKAVFTPGTRLDRLDARKLSLVGSGDLGTALNLYTPVYVRSYAGGLSTIQLRGTSPDHTVVLFEGESLNSLTLGHANLSSLPTFFFDEVILQYGGSSALNGSGAIGGTLQLQSNLSAQEGISVNLQQEAASFGTYFTGGKFQYANQKFGFSSKLYYRNSENNFPFKTNMYDFEKKQYFTDKQNHSAYGGLGMLQEAFFKLDPNTTISLKYLDNNTWREVQPKMSSNNDMGSRGYIEGYTRRLIFSIDRKNKDQSRLIARVSGIDDLELANRTDTISTRRITTQLEYAKPLARDAKLLAGAWGSYVVPRVHAYNGDIDEKRVDLFVSGVKEFKSRTSLGINLRESFTTRFVPVFSPSINLSQKFAAGDKNLFTLNGSLSRSFRLPTFNDLYWSNWGNPDLKPEKGYQWETGVSHLFQGEQQTSKGDVSVYEMWVDNWIQWVPVTGKWTPVNHKRVRVNGVDLSWNYQIKIASHSLEWSAKYSFNRSIPVEAYDEKDATLGKQLPYKPVHGLCFYALLELGKWRIQPDLGYTGKRRPVEGEIVHVTDLDGYWLVNLHLSRSMHLNKSVLVVSGRVNNILNTRYENILDYAMPGIHGSITLQYFFNSPLYNSINL
jgi:vitamin B12 transporter